MKKVIALCLALVLLLAVMPIGAVSAATTGTYNGITYEIESGQVTLTGYTSALPKALVIPDTIEGYPVTAIGYKAFEDSSITSVLIPDSVIELDNYAFAWCRWLRTATVGHGVTTINYGAFSYCSRLTTLNIGRGAIDIDSNAFMSNGDLTAVNIDPDNPVYCSPDGVLYNKSMTYLIYYPGGKPGAYTVPEGVTHLYGGAFDFCDTITAITLPSTMTGIPEQGFTDCENFAAIHVAENNPYMASVDGIVYSKDMKTLMFCPSGRTGAVVIPEGVTAIRGSAFHHCERMSSVTIPNTVTTIGSTAFGYCHSLQSVTIPDSVTTIGDYLFYDCNNLTTAHVGDGITRLSQMTFYDCHNLKNIRLPDHLTYIGFKAIWNTAYYNNTANWTGGVLYFGNYLIDTKSSLSGDYVIPEGTTVVAEYSFHERKKLTSVTIPEGVRAIEYSTFSRCEKLAYVILPKSLTFVGEWAFSYCTKLTDVYYYGSKNDVSNITFSNYNDPLIKALWHVNYTHIRSGTTGDCTWVLDSGYLTISGNGAMADYAVGQAPWGSDIISVTIEDGVTHIGDAAFYNCEVMTSVTIPDSVTSIGARAFEWCNFLTSITLPDGVTEIGEGAFTYCGNIRSIVIPDGVTTIRKQTFSGCYNLQSVTIPNSVASIGNGAFDNCHCLSDVTIPDSVTSIGSFAFAECYSLTTLCIPASVVAIGDNAFFSYASPFIEVDDANPNYCSVDGILFDKEQTTLIHFPTGYTGTYTIPDTVTTIAGSAFFASNLTEVTIPKSVTTIGNTAFYDCWSLTDVYYGGTEADWAAVTIDNYNHSLDTVTIHYAPEAEPLLGDVDGNGKVNNRDLGRLQQYINEWDVTIVVDSADMDGNGKVNNRDLGRLQLYINEWEAE